MEAEQIDACEAVETVIMAESGATAAAGRMVKTVCHECASWTRVPAARYSCGAAQSPGIESSANRSSD